jgi:hypothetical protein
MADRRFKPQVEMVLARACEWLNINMRELLAHKRDKALEWKRQVVQCCCGR